MTDEFIPRRPVVVAYPKMPEAFAEADLIVNFLKEKGFDVPHGSIYDEDLRKRIRSGEYDLLIAVVDAELHDRARVVTPAFALIKKGMQSYTPEWQEPITTIPARSASSMATPTTPRRPASGRR